MLATIIGTPRNMRSVRFRFFFFLSVVIYNPVEQEVMAGQCHAPCHPGVLKNANMKGNILQIYFIQEIL